MLISLTGLAKEYRMQPPPLLSLGSVLLVSWIIMRLPSGWQFANSLPGAPPGPMPGPGFGQSSLGLPRSGSEAGSLLAMLDESKMLISLGLVPSLLVPLTVIPHSECSSLIWLSSERNWPTCKVLKLQRTYSSHSSPEGEAVGDAVGPAVGEADGLGVGTSLGSPVGEAVGPAVGELVGTPVG